MLDLNRTLYPRISQECVFITQHNNHHKQIYFIISNCDTSFSVRWINPLTPNDLYSGRTAPLTSKRCILYIYSTNIGTEYFKHGIYSPFSFLFKTQFVS